MEIQKKIVLKERSWTPKKKVAVATAIGLCASLALSGCKKDDDAVVFGDVGNPSDYTVTMIEESPDKDTLDKDSLKTCSKVDSTKIDSAKIDTLIKKANEIERKYPGRTRGVVVSPQRKK